MEKNQDNLKNALAKMNDYEPDEKVWSALSQNMDELPLKTALSEMPLYEPDEQLWNLIVHRPEKTNLRATWRYAAAAILIGIIGNLLFQKTANQSISYSQEKADERLQADGSLLTDEKYAHLKAYCETETLVCNSKNYKRLQQEYEKLDAAADQLQQAIGAYNTEPELVRQFSAVEEQKAEVLNEMAKMI
ncbi:hypothetical protein [Dyadobacter luticola]|uniref:Uncharacterized protein n=1 Tax=Dyadobacter luticola TaxID=1979387 RepID=A0A5R9L0U7_9BACT|nr:hypothetical protein [Dyadobacter luticola]TLV02176.1 hypothetical protein FEN17_00610 [Dyadobacter luticola]